MLKISGQAISEFNQNQAHHVIILSWRGVVLKYSILKELKLHRKDKNRNN